MLLPGTRGILPIQYNARHTALDWWKITMMFPQLHTFGVHTGICKYIIAYMLLHIIFLQVNTKSTASNTSNTLSTDTLQTL